MTSGANRVSYLCYRCCKKTIFTNASINVKRILKDVETRYYIIKYKSLLKRVSISQISKKTYLYVTFMTFSIFKFLFGNNLYLFGNLICPKIRPFVWSNHVNPDKKNLIAHTRMLRAALNIDWKNHPTIKQLYGNFPRISNTLCDRWLRSVGHSWRSKKELVSDILL